MGNTIELVRSSIEAVAEDYAARDAVGVECTRACKLGQQKKHEALCRAYVNCEMEIIREVRYVRNAGALLCIVHPKAAMRRAAP